MKSNLIFSSVDVTGKHRKMTHFCFMSQTDSKRGLKVLTVSSRKKVDTFSAFSAKVQIVPYRCTLFFLLTALKQAEKQTIRPLNYKSARVEVDELLSSNNSKEAQQKIWLPLSFYFMLFIQLLLLIHLSPLIFLPLILFSKRQSWSPLSPTFVLLLLPNHYMVIIAL